MRNALQLNEKVSIISQHSSRTSSTSERSANSRPKRPVAYSAYAGPISLQQTGISRSEDLEQVTNDDYDFWKSPATQESLVSLALEIMHNPQQSVPEATE
jgi:hypothetical protein